MKKIMNAKMAVGVGVTAMSVMGAALTGCGSSGEKVATENGAVVLDDQPIKGMSAVLTVYGMSCPLCANNVDKVLLAVPGVTGVQVDMGSGRAVVSLDVKNPPSKRELAQAVDKSGFSLKGIEVQ